MILAAAVAFLSSPFAQAQLNDKKFERDASGVYKGSIQGGSLVYIVSGLPSPPYVPEKETGNFRLPVKDGKASSNLTDTDLPGDGTADCSGKWKKTKVQRGGKKIALQGTGTLAGDNSTASPWTNGRTTGSLTDRGPKWTADCKLSAVQNVPETTDPIDPMITYPAYTTVITGLKAGGAQ